MAGFTKLFGSILASTVWREDDKVRLVWITLLAMADQRGVAEGSVPGIADLARVSLEDCERALGRLQEPDRYSRSQDHGGRRIEPVEGGFRVLNHARYREKLSADERREYRRKWAEDRRAAGFCEHGVNTREHGVNSCERCEHKQKQKQKQSKNPPNPPKGGRSGKPTRDERQKAERMIKHAFGCTHQPRCQSHEACVLLVVQGLRERAS